MNEERLDRRFLYYYMQSDEFTNQWNARKAETDMADYVSLTSQRELTVALPEIVLQRSIGQFLGALDSKIELNRRMNRTLEHMGAQLFKSWFVEFDPVVAKAAGRKPYGMDEATAALFPKGFEESDLGPIPKGWRISKIGDAVRVVGGSTPRTEVAEFWVEGQHCWVTPRDLSRLSDPVVLSSERYITDKGLAQVSSGLLPVGTVLLSSRAPIGYLAITEVPVAVNQGFIAMVCNDSLPNQYAFHWTRENLDEVIGRAGGTTFAEISKQNFRPIPLLIPEDKLLRLFQLMASTWHGQIVANVKETQYLSELRQGWLRLFGQISLGR